MNVTTQVEAWRTYWQRVTDPSEVERQIQRLRWLEEFAFHCGNAVGVDEFRGLQQQIETGEKKLAELRGGFAVVISQPQPETSYGVNR